SPPGVFPAVRRCVTERAQKAATGAATSFLLVLSGGSRWQPSPPAAMRGGLRDASESEGCYVAGVALQTRGPCHQRLFEVEKQGAVSRARELAVRRARRSAIARRRFDRVQERRGRGDAGELRGRPCQTLHATSSRS